MNDTEEISILHCFNMGVMSFKLGVGIDMTFM